jgi:hypothetical protein
VKAIIGNRLAPGLLDHYLAATGYESQQTSEPEDPDRPNHLWEPVAGDHGAHGVFDARSSDVSPQLWAATHRAATLGSVLAAAAMIIGAALMPSPDPPPRNGDRTSLSRNDREALRHLIETPA